MRTAGPYPTAQQGTALRATVTRLHGGLEPENIILVPTSDEDPYGILLAKWKHVPYYEAWSPDGEKTHVFPMSMGYFKMVNEGRMTEAER